MANKLHQGTIACFVQDENDQTCGLTSEHVILHSDGKIYTRDQLNTNNELGTCNTRGNTIKLDVGLVKIHKGIRHLCRNEVCDSNGCKRSWKPFNGTHETLAGKHVFKCIPLNKRLDNTKYTKLKTTLTGTVPSLAIHQQHLDVLGNRYFLVASEDPLPFAIESESGTLLAMDIGDSDVYLIGIISGMFQKENSQKFIICVFLSAALRMLTSTENSRLSLSPASNIENKAFAHDAIVCGSTIFFKGVEQVGKLDFKIDEQVLRLFNLSFSNDDDNSSSEIVHRYERQFRKSVFQRTTINAMALYTPNGPEQIAIIYFYLTVQSLYAQDHKSAKKFLKEAIRGLCKAKYSQLRLLCKCVTYVTWYYLDTDNMTKLENVLAEGLIFFEENVKLQHFPLECLAYHYYDYSRYYMKNDDRDKAISMAKLGYECLKRLLDSKQNEPTEIRSDLFHRYVFAVCQYASSMLWCGEYFEYSKKNIPNADVTLAFDLVRSLEPDIERTPAIQRIEYYLVKCDLCYRKEDVQQAFMWAELGFKEAKEHSVEDELCFAGKRLTALRKILKSMHQENRV